MDREQLAALPKTEILEEIEAVAEVAPEPDHVDPQPEPARQQWLKPLSSYDRRESSWIHGARFG
jgi:hypothetical protein